MGRERGRQYHRVAGAIASMKQWKPLYAIVAVAIVLLLLAAALFVRIAGRKPGPDPPPAASTTAPLSRSTAPAPSGRERCMRKCAARHLGYIYGPEQRAEGPGGRIVQPETCTCM